MDGTALSLEKPLLGESPRYSFSGHHTFPFRYAWLPKGVAAVRSDRQAFSRPDALVQLGVGKNMVASIRFWCEACGLISGSSRCHALTPLAKLLFGTDSFMPPPPPWRTQ